MIFLFDGNGKAHITYTAASHRMQSETLSLKDRSQANSPTLGPFITTLGEGAFIRLPMDMKAVTVAPFFVVHDLPTEGV